MIRYYLIQGLQNNRDIHEWATEPPGGVECNTWGLESVRGTDKGLLRLNNADLTIHNKMQANGVPITPFFTNDKDTSGIIVCRVYQLGL